MRGIFVAALATLAVAASAATPAQLIVRLQSASAAAAVARAHRLALSGITADAPFALLTLGPDRTVEQVQAELIADPRVVWAEDNVEVVSPEGQGAIRGTTIPAIGGRSQLYAANTNLLTQINWSSALAEAPGRDVRIAILDTGLTRARSYLWSNVVGLANFVEKGSLPYDMPRNCDSNGNGELDEAVGHGTMIAGIVDQVAPKAKMLIARVADSDGNATAWTIVQGLAFAATHGAEVANISLGSTQAIPALSDVADWCEENDLLVVSGIGNDNTGRALYPARITKVVCVSGLLPDNRKADFSNWDGHCDSAAPATGIVSQWWNGQMGTWSGTSFASPMVAAAVADCLRRTTPQPLGFLRDAVVNSGRNIDALNPAYGGELGTLLDIQSLNSAIVGSGGRGR